MPSLTLPQTSTMSEPVVNVYDPPSAPKKEPPRNFWRKTVQRLRPGFILDHLLVKSAKVVLPTFTHVWATVFLTVIPRTSVWIGTSPYLMLILAFICMCGGFSVSINIWQALICFTAMLVGWLFTVVAMAILTHIRGWKTLAELSAELVAEGTCTVDGLEDCVTTQIYSGRYLDARCLVIYSVALVLGITVLGMFLTVHKMARTPYVTGAISIVINTCLSVFIPVFDPTLIGLAVLRPAGVSFAIKIVCLMLIFPFSSSFKYFDAGAEVLSLLQNMAGKHRSFYKSMQPSHDGFENYKGISRDVQKTRGKFAACHVFLQSTRVELSYGRFKAQDAYEFDDRVRSLLTTFSGFQYYYELLQERKDMVLNIVTPRFRHGSLLTPTAGNKLYTAFSQTYDEVGRFEKSEYDHAFSKKYREAHSVTLADLDMIAGVVRQAHEDYLDVICSTIEVAHDWLAAANHYRLYSIFSRNRHALEQEKQHKRVLNAKKALLQIVERYDKAENAVSVEMLKGIEGRELVLSLISQTSTFLFMCAQVATLLERLFDLYLRLDAEQPRPQFVWCFGRIPRKGAGDGQDVEDQMDDLRDTIKAQRNPDALPPRTILQIAAFLVFRAYKLACDKGIWYHLHCAMLINFCTFPFYFHHSAPFFYSRKIVWFPVVAAVSTTQSSADSLYTFIAKIYYTFVGALAGVVGWYVSTGLGNGNYYGYTAVCGFIYFFAACYRHFSMHAFPIPGIMLLVTPVLVLGTSWVDAQYNVLEVGWGWEVGVVRFVSVIAGLLVVFTMTFFPNIRSSKAALRKRLAIALEQINVTQVEVCNFAIKRLLNPTVHIKLQDDRLASEVRAHLAQLLMIRGAMALIKYETAVTGPWPTEKYERLHQLIVSITQLQFLLYSLIDQVEDPESWIPHMASRAAWNREFLSDVLLMTYMASEALRLRTPLPEITVATLLLKHLDVVSDTWGMNGLSFNERIFRPKEETLSSDDEQLPTIAEKNSFENPFLTRRNLRTLDFEKLLSHDGRLNVVALLISHLIYKQIDQAIFMVKGLVGEKYEFDSQLFEL